MTAIDNVRVKEGARERKRKRTREQRGQSETKESFIFFLLVLFVLRSNPCCSGDYCSGRRRDNRSPLLVMAEGYEGEDASCMLIRQNTNWKDGKAKKEKTRPPFQLQTPPFLPLSAGDLSLMSANQMVIGSTLSGAPQTV